MKIVVNGCAGRMGQTLLRLIHLDPELDLFGGLEPKGHPQLGADLGHVMGMAPLGMQVSDQALDIIKDADAIIDFSVPESSVAMAELAAQARLVHVIGTTGFSDADLTAIEAAARHATIIKSGNMSLGVNLLAALVKRAAAALDPSWDIEILDMHHRHKVDAPSGTALLLGEAAAAGRGIPLSGNTETGRDGVGSARQEGAIGIAALRGGSVVGDHDVIFAGAHEQIRLSHRAENRDIFASGALAAAKWGHGQPPGLYAMRDVLGLED